MLVVRGLGETTVVVVIEGDDAGQVRLREVRTDSLAQVLAASTAGARSIPARPGFMPDWSHE